MKLSNMQKAYQLQVALRSYHKALLELDDAVAFSISHFVQAPVSRTGEKKELAPLDEAEKLAIRKLLEKIYKTRIASVTMSLELLGIEVDVSGDQLEG